MPGSLALFRVFTYAPLPPPAVGTGSSKYYGVLQSGTDAEDGGKFKIIGTTKITGTPATPVRVRVSLHSMLSGRLIRSQWSDPLTGAYSFLNISNGSFYVVAFDHLKNYRAVIADQLVPEAMT